MYTDYFKFKKPPFTLTPDPSFLFLSRDHRDALAHLLYGIKESAGFVQLTGEVGTGKTTLCRYLLERAPEGVDVALILNPRLTAEELLASVCDELRIDYPSDPQSIKTLVDRLNRYLLERHGQGRRTVLVIDEAQNLSPEVLEQVRLLTNLETATTKLLQIILIGQPELRAMMKRPDLRQLAQRVIARYHLTPLSREETAAYIRHRLKVAGCTRALFTEAAIRQIHRLSGGVPRLINVLCDRALLGAYARSKTLVDVAMIRIAGKDVQGEPIALATQKGWRQAAGILASVAVGIGISVLIWQTFVRGTGSSSRITVPVAPVEPAPQAVGRVPEISSPVTKTAIPETAPPAALKASPAPVETKSSVPAVGGTMMPPDGSEAAHLDLAEWLSRAGARTMTEDAFATLLSYWNLDSEYLPDPPGCSQALAAGLQCLELTGSLEDILAYNRPVILEFRSDDRAVHHVVLAEAFPSGLLLDMTGVRETFDAETVSSLWTGRFVLLWRPPPLKRFKLAEGLEGADVLWLRQQLNRALGIDYDPQMRYPVFDEELKERVKAFQEARNIKADGVVGRRTLLELNAEAGGLDVPLLRDTSEALQDG